MIHPPLPPAACTVHTLVTLIDMLSCLVDHRLVLHAPTLHNDIDAAHSLSTAPLSVSAPRRIRVVTRMQLFTLLSFSLLSLLVLLSSRLPSTSARSPEEWKSRTIYQLLTDRYARDPNNTARCTDAFYCGGNFNYLRQNLDYIQALGCDAVWISPVVENAANGFHGYWATNILQINPHWGTPDEFKQLSAELHKRDMWLMVDVVANHMASLEMVHNNYSRLIPFDRPEYYHDCNGCDPYCNIVQWDPPNLTQIEHCRISGLMDLNQSLPLVRQTLKQWIHDLVANYSIDGLRIDTFHLVKPAFWTEFYASAGVYSVGEVDHTNVSYVGYWQHFGPDVLSYPLFWNMRWVWTSGKSSMKLLYNLYQQYLTDFRDVTTLATFTDNHDNPRFLSLTKDPAIYRSALAYVLVSIGVPIIYYGSEQGYDSSQDPYSREPLWTSGYNQSHPYFIFISTLAHYRKAVQLGYYPQSFPFVTDQVLALQRGNSTLLVVTQAGAGGGDIKVTVDGLDWADGVQLTNVVRQNETYVVKNGAVQLIIVGGEPIVLTAIADWRDRLSSSPAVARAAVGVADE